MLSTATPTKMLAPSWLRMPASKGCLRLDLKPRRWIHLNLVKQWISSVLGINDLLIQHLLKTGAAVVKGGNDNLWRSDYQNCPSAQAWCAMPIPWWIWDLHQSNCIDHHRPMYTPTSLQPKWSLQNLIYSQLHSAAFNMVSNFPILLALL